MYVHHYIHCQSIKASANQSNRISLFFRSNLSVANILTRQKYSEQQILESEMACYCKASTPVSYTHLTLPTTAYV